MKVTLLNGNVMNVPFTAFGTTGYVAKSIEITADDVFQMRMFLIHNPHELRAILGQLEARFEERRVEFRNAPPT